MTNLAISIQTPSTPTEIISFPKGKHYNSRPGNHNHTQQRVSPIRDTQKISEIYKALRNSGRYGLRNATIFALQLAIGRRTNDIAAMRLSTIYDFKHNQVKSTITVDEHKTGKTARDLPLGSKTRAILQEYISTLKIQEPDSLLFPSQKSSSDGSQRPLNTSSIDGIYKKYTAQVFTESDSQTHISSYAARKTFGYNLLQECNKNHNGMLPGTNIPALQYIQSVYNHNSSLTTLRYMGAYDAPASDLAESIEDGYDFGI